MEEASDSADRQSPDRVYLPDPEPAPPYPLNELVIYPKEYKPTVYGHVIVLGGDHVPSSLWEVPGEDQNPELRRMMPKLIQRALEKLEETHGPA